MEESGGRAVLGHVRSGVVLADEAEEVGVGSHLDVEGEVRRGRVVVHDEEGELARNGGKLLSLDDSSVSHGVSSLTVVAGLEFCGLVGVNGSSGGAFGHGAIVVG